MSRPGEPPSTPPRLEARTSLPTLDLAGNPVTPSSPLPPRISLPTLDLPGAFDVTAPADAELAGVAAPKASPAVVTRGRDLVDCLGGLDLGVTAEHPDRYGPPLRELGQGGIGRVVVTNDRHLGREVAMKELLADVQRGTAGRPDALPALARFLREARITGQLEHPSIVPVYELGRRADGSIYYTMRVVRGRTLADAIAAARTLPARLALLDHFIGLCQAIAYAHSRGVVHRDIKPDNVMIGEFGETVVLDWGIAKTGSCARAGRRSDGPAAPDVQEPRSLIPVVDPLALELTLDGAICGTPSHMSPEQARGAIHEVDERSDVWALGVTLYTILCGRTPFNGGTLVELVQAIREGKRPALSRVDPQIPPELAAIVDRALEPERARRYADAEAFLRDLEAFRAGARVAAYAYSALELLRRFLQRHRTAAVASGVGLCVALVLAVASYIRLAAERDRALQAERRATVNERQARTSARAANQSLSEMLVEKAQQALADFDAISAGVLAAQALALEERPDARGLMLLAETAFRPEFARSFPKSARCSRFALRASAGVAACARGNLVELYFLGDARPAAPSQVASEVSLLELSADGSQLIVSLRGGVTQVAKIVDGALGQWSSQPGRTASALAVANGGNYTAVADNAGNVIVRSASAPASEWRVELGQAVATLAFTPAADALVIGGELGKLTLLRLAQHERRELAGHNGTVRALAFAQQGHYLASGSADRSVRLWDLTTGVAAAPPIATPDAVTALDWSEDGHLLALGSKDKSFTLLDPKNDLTRAKVHFHDDSVELVAFDGSGHLFTASDDIGLIEWSLPLAARPTALIDRGNVLALSAVPGHDDEIVSAGLGSTGVAVWQLATGASTRLPAGLERVRALDISADGRALLFAGSGQQAFLWDLGARIPLGAFDAGRDEVRAVAFSHNGKRLAFAALDGTLRVLDATSYAVLSERALGSPLHALAALPGARWVVGARDGSLSLWDEASPKPLSRLQAHDDWLLALAVSRDAQRIATASADRLVKVWSARDGKLLNVLKGHEGKVLSVAFSADGRWIASGGEDKSVRLWDASSGRELARIAGHRGAVRSVRFGPRGSLISGADDGTIRLWPLAIVEETADSLRQRSERRFHVALEGTRVTRTPLP